MMGTSQSRQQRTGHEEERDIQQLSVVIPALNEEQRIGTCLDSVRDHGLKQDPEVIVVDGGSVDRTMQIAKKAGATVVSSPKGRGKQLNRGWKSSRGDWILFLHADNRLPSRYGASMQSTICRNPQSSWGCFSSIETDLDEWRMRLITNGIRLRTRWFHMPYGDQAFFVKSTMMRKLDGFKDVRLLEDVDFVCRARKQGFGNPMLIPSPVFTSGRRWKDLGIWKTTFVNQGIMFAYFMGVDNDTLADWYYNKKRT